MTKSAEDRPAPQVSGPRDRTTRGRPGRGLYGHLVDIVGQEIVDGVYVPGSIISPEQLGTRFDASRSVVRESVRVLESLGLVEARPQVGTRVLPLSNWDLLSPKIIEWRANGPGFLLQMRELLELRLGIEPVGAWLSATRMTREDIEQVKQAAEDMDVAAQSHDNRAFFAADARFHHLILARTGNAVITQFADVVDAMLHSRLSEPRYAITDLTPPSVRRHKALARSLEARDAEASREQSHDIVGATLDEFNGIGEL